MTREDYLEIRKNILPLLKPNNLKASITLILCGLFLFITLFLSQSEVFWIWFIGQFLLGISILQFFFLFHDLGHQNHFSSKKMNVIIGHLAGLVCALPYYSWHYIHSTHHEWTGWREKDPTLPKVRKTDLNAFQKTIINFCWRFYVPIFTSIFAIFNFWNYNKLCKLFPEKKQKINNFISILFIISFYIFISWFFGFFIFIKTYALGLFFFLIFSDPLLISQHAGIRQHSVKEADDLKPLPYYKQEKFTRSLNFPKFINDFILFGFNQHSIHHLFPKVPCYNLIQIKLKTSINQGGFKWIRDTKKILATDFMFEVNEDPNNISIETQN